MSSHARISFSVPKPPSNQDTRDNPDKTLAWINERVRELISAFEQTTDETLTLDRGAYLVIYSAVHDFVRSRAPGGLFLGGRLYHELADIIRSNCKYLRSKILQKNSDAVDKEMALMQTYLAEWKRHCSLAKLIAHLFGTLDRHWITREIDEGKSGVYRIQDLHSRIWKEEVILVSSQLAQDSESAQHGSESFLDVAMRLRERDDLTPGQQAPSFLDEIFSSFDEASIKIVGTWMSEQPHGLSPLHNIDPAKVKRETLASGLKVTHLV